MTSTPFSPSVSGSRGTSSVSADTLLIRLVEGVVLPIRHHHVLRGLVVVKGSAEQTHLNKLRHMHVLALFDGEEHEATIMWEASVRSAQSGQGDAPNGFDRVGIDLPSGKNKFQNR